MNIAVIPARGGSKRIPRKNIKLFHGKPMIAWSISTALASGLFDEVIVSTDDDEIAAVAEANGARAPFRRPPELADDDTPTLPVIAHALRWRAEHNTPVKFVCCIYATAPFLQTEYLREGIDLLRARKDADFVFSIASFASTIFRALRRDINGQVEMFWPENELKRSQDLPEAWHDAGQFYWGRADAFLSHQGVFSARAYSIILPRDVVQDIDTPQDWARAERMFAANYPPGFVHE